MNANQSLTRRNFISTTAVAGAAAVLSSKRVAAAATSSPEKLRLGLIGCGGRGYGAVADSFLADPSTELVAIGDLFADRVEALESQLPRSIQGRAKQSEQVVTDAQAGEMVAKRAAVPADKRFVGWDAYKQVCAIDEVDIIVMAPPPVFRPLHFAAAMAANKHVFLEKPVCVDAVGARKMLELADVADAKKLCVIAGTQRRHQASYIEGLKRVEDGQIGDIMTGQFYWQQSGYVGSSLKATELAVENIRYQVRNWPVFIWTSGDQMVEQHVHNIDIMLWAMGRLPQSCVGQGGRAIDLPMPEYGNRFSNFAAEYDFGNELYTNAYCRQEPGTYSRVFERIVGTKGAISFNWGEVTITGENPWNFEGPETDPYVQEHKDLIAAIRSGNHVNETRQVTESCATALLGRESAYTGRSIKYDWLVQRSQQNLTPDVWEDGLREIDPLPIPGKTELV